MSDGAMPDSVMSDSAMAEAEQGARLVVGCRYAFDDLGAYEVTGLSIYSITADDGSSLSWDSWGLVGVSEDNEGAYLCVVASSHLGLCYAVEVEPGERPARAQPFAPYCGEAAVSDCQCVSDLAPRPAGETVLFRTRMDSWLDNGASAERHDEIGDASIIWVEERFTELPKGEEHKFPEMLNLQLKRVGRFRGLS